MAFWIARREVDAKGRCHFLRLHTGQTLGGVVERGYQLCPHTQSRRSIISFMWLIAYLYVRVMQQLFCTIFQIPRSSKGGWGNEWLFGIEYVLIRVQSFFERVSVACQFDEDVIKPVERGL